MLTFALRMLIGMHVVFIVTHCSHVAYITCMPGCCVCCMIRIYSMSVVHAFCELNVMYVTICNDSDNIMDAYCVHACQKCMCVSACVLLGVCVCAVRVPGVCMSVCAWCVCVWQCA